MYEKKNKFSSLAPSLDEITVRLADAVFGVINEKHSFFYGSFGRYRSVVPILDHISGFLYFLE